MLNYFNRTLVFLAAVLGLATSVSTASKITFSKVADTDTIVPGATNSVRRGTRRDSCWKLTESDGRRPNAGCSKTFRRCVLAPQFDDTSELGDN